MLERPLRVLRAGYRKYRNIENKKKKKQATIFDLTSDDESESVSLSELFVTQATIIDLISDDETESVSSSELSFVSADADESSGGSNVSMQEPTISVQMTNKTDVCCDYCYVNFSMAAVTPCGRRMCEGCFNNVRGRHCASCNADRNFWVLVSIRLLLNFFNLFILFSFLFRDLDLKSVKQAERSTTASNIKRS